MLKNTIQVLSITERYGDEISIKVRVMNEKWRLETIDLEVLRQDKKRFYRLSAPEIAKLNYLSALAYNHNERVSKH